MSEMGLGDSGTTDGQLVARARDGDAAAFAELVRRFAPMAFGTARSRVRDRATASDVVQDAFTAAFERLRSLRTPERFGAWLRRFPGIAQTVEPRKGIRVMSKTRETRKGTGENCTCGCWRRDEAPERRGMGGAEKTARGQEKTAERLAAAEKPPRRTAARRPQVST